MKRHEIKIRRCGMKNEDYKDKQGKAILSH